MTTRKRTTVTIETRHRTVVRTSMGQMVAWCEQCRAEVLLLQPDEVAAFVRITAGDFYRRVESGEVHFVKADDGALLICRNSPAAADSEKEWRYEDGQVLPLAVRPLASSQSFFVRIQQLVMTLWRVRP